MDDIVHHQQRQIKIAWWVAFLSAFVGTFSHVFLDSIMRVDLELFYPFSKSNAFLNLISVSALHKFCIYSGVMGGAAFFAINWFQKFNGQRQPRSIFRRLLGRWSEQEVHE